MEDDHAPKLFLQLLEALRIRSQKYHAAPESVKTEAVNTAVARPGRKKGRATRGSPFLAIFIYPVSIVSSIAGRLPGLQLRTQQGGSPHLHLVIIFEHIIFHVAMAEPCIE